MSRSKTKTTAYHHGDLRNTLIETGLKVLTEQGEQALSMRKLAKQAGVSHNAPYMHFADKEALLAAIAEEGFHILTNAVDTAVSTTEGDWYQQLQNGSWAYVNFALEHPSHLQVMFRSFDHEKYPSLIEASTNALTRLQQIIDEGQQLKMVKDGNSRQLATCVWSLLHGMATIMAGGKMPPVVIGEAAPEQLVHQFVDLLCQGLLIPSDSA